MNTRSSSWTGRSARDMQSAFGPYTSNQITEDRPFDFQDKLVMVAGLICAICVIAIVLVGQP